MYNHKNYFFFINLFRSYIPFFLVLIFLFSNAVKAESSFNNNINSQLLSLLNKITVDLQKYPSMYKVHSLDKIETLKNNIHNQDLEVNFEHALSILEDLIISSHTLRIKEITADKQQMAYFISVGNLAFYKIHFEANERIFIWNPCMQKWDIHGDANTKRHVHEIWRIANKVQPGDWTMIPMTSLQTISSAKLTSTTYYFAKQLPYYLTSSSLHGKLKNITSYIRNSSLTALIPFESNLPTRTQKEFELLHFIDHIINIHRYAGQIIYVDNDSKYQNKLPFIFIGSFAIFSDPTFYYKDPADEQFKALTRQPNLGFILKAVSLSKHKKNTHLIPVNTMDRKRQSELKDMQNSTFFLNPATVLICTVGVMGICTSIIFILNMLLLNLNYLNRRLSAYRWLNPIFKTKHRIENLTADNKVVFFNKMIEEQKQAQLTKDYCINKIINILWITFAIVLLVAAYSIWKKHSSSDDITFWLTPILLNISFIILTLFFHAILKLLHRILLVKLEKNISHSDVKV